VKERRLRESLELHKRRVLLVKILQLFRYITFVFLMRACVCVCVCVCCVVYVDSTESTCVLDVFQERVMRAP
jgi:hypothetical protein